MHHYTRLLRYGSPDDPEKRELPDLCEHCDHPRAVGTLCWAHYTRQRKYGDPLGGPPLVRRSRRPSSDPASCIASRCTRAAQTAGYCRAHYRRHLKGADMDKPLRLVGKNAHAEPLGCSVEGCKRPHSAHGYCHPHYEQARRTGEVTSPPCAVPDCDRAAESRGLCSGHYQRVYLKGQRLEDQKRLRAKPGSGHQGRNGYRYVKGRNGRTVGEHRVVWERENGRDLLPGEEVHHKNTVKNDNHPANLELWVKSQPAGGRVEDLIPYWIDMLRRYAPEALADPAQGRDLSA